MIRVLLADDHPAFLRGLQTMLAETGQIDVVGTATDGRAAVEAARELIDEGTCGFWERSRVGVQAARPAFSD